MKRRVDSGEGRTWGGRVRTWGCEGEGLPAVEEEGGELLGKRGVNAGDKMGVERGEGKYYGLGGGGEREGEARWRGRGKCWIKQKG